MGLGKNLGPLRHDSTSVLRCQGKWVYFGGVFGYFGVILGSQMCGAATLDVQEMGWSGKLGPGKN